ncbi:MAG: hypothetical protein ABW166_02230 [Sedimenticola sp.]
MHIPDHRNKSATDILAIMAPLDSATYFYLAICWFDLYTREGKFQVLLNAAISARMGIEYLLFEEVLLSCEDGLSEEEYKKCLKDSRKLEKVLNRLQPEYVKLKEFTQAFAKLEPKAPILINWDIKALLKQWGVLSSILHWCGANIYTTMSDEWLSKTGVNIGGVIESLWNKKTSGQSGIMHVNDMKPDTKLIWEAFKAGKINSSSVIKRLEIMRPIIERQNV